jgi:chromosome segregation ATPase
MNNFLKIALSSALVITLSPAHAEPTTTMNVDSEQFSSPSDASKFSEINAQLLKLTADSEAVKASLETKLAEQLASSELIVASKDDAFRELNSKYDTTVLDSATKTAELNGQISRLVSKNAKINTKILKLTADGEAVKATLETKLAEQLINSESMLAAKDAIIGTLNSKYISAQTNIKSMQVELEDAASTGIMPQSIVTRDLLTQIDDLNHQSKRTIKKSHSLTQQITILLTRNNKIEDELLALTKKSIKLRLSMNGKLQDSIKLTNGQETLILNLTSKINSAKQASNKLAKQNKVITSRLLNDNFLINKKWTNKFTALANNQKSVIKLINKRDNSISNLNAKLLNSANVNHTLKKRFDEASTKLNKQISALISTNSSIEKAIKALSTKSKENKKALNLKIKEQNIANQKAITSKDEAIGSLKKKYSATKSIADSADDRIAKISDSLNQQISLLLGINAKIDSEIKSLKSTSAKVSAELETKIKEQNIANQKAIASKDEAMGLLQNKYIATKTIADSSDGRIAKISDSLNAQISLLLGINAKIDSEIKSLKKTSAKVNSDLEEKLAQQISTNKIIISGKDASIKALEGEIVQSAKTYKSELSSLVDSGNLTTVTLGEKSLELKKSTQKLNKLILDYKSEKESILNDNKNLINKLAKLNARFSASTDANTGLKINLKNITTSLNKQISILISKNDEIENQFKDLTTKSDEVKATLELKLEEQNINNQKVIAAKDSKIGSLEKIYSSTKTMADSASDKLAKKTTSLNKQISLLLSVNATIDSEITNLKKTSATVNSALESKLATQISNNNDIIASKDGLIHDLKSKIIGFDKEHKLELSKLIAENSLSQKSFQDINANLKSLKDKLKNLIVIHSSEKKSLLSKNANLAKKVDSLKDMAYKEATLTDISAVSKNNIIASHMEQLNNLKQIVNQLKSPTEIKKYIS